MKSLAAIGFVLFSLFLVPVAVEAAAPQGDGGCMMDAFTYCGQFIPDRERVAACLKSNHNRISAGCREALKRFK
jgi:hypothetical protein